MKVGDVFGKLTILALSRGRKGADGLADCRCECGNARSVRKSKLRVGAIAQCAPCGHRAGVEKRMSGITLLPEDERQLTYRFGQYKQNARAKGFVFEITKREFGAIIQSACCFCGVSPAMGVDRTDSAQGYFAGNINPCCSICNYAKRDMPVELFLAWITRASAYQAALREDF